MVAVLLECCDSLNDELRARPGARVISGICVSGVRAFNRLYGYWGHNRLDGTPGVEEVTPLGSVRASRSMHHDTTTRLVHAPLSWYEANPSGRVLSRFASDLGVCDMNLWQDVDVCSQDSNPRPLPWSSLDRHEDEGS